MPVTAEDQARAIGFLQPKVVQIRMRLGEKFTFNGVTSKGVPYELRYEIIDFDRTSITLKMEGEVGNSAIMRNVKVHARVPLKANEPINLPQLIRFGQPDIYIAFLAPRASEFRPIQDSPLLLALGDVGDTVSPPQPPPDGA